MKSESPAHSLESAIRLHFCRMRKIASCEAPLYLLGRCTHPSATLTRRETLVNLDAKALQVAFELAADTDGTHEGSVVQEVITTPLRVLLALGDKCLVNIEVGKMVTFLDCEFPPMTFCGFLITVMLYPYGAL